MGEAKKKRLVDAIQAQNPAIAAKIQEKIFTFDDISQLHPRSVQTLINEVQHEDLIVSLKVATQKVREKLLANMSERKRAMVEDDYNNLPPMRLSEVEEAKRRVLNKADELRTSGRLQTGGDDSDVWV